MQTGTRYHRLLGIVLATGITAGMAAGTTAQKIPELHGKTFADTPVDLPAILQGKVGILVLGFSQDSRDAVTVWGTKLATDYEDSTTVIYYEMPVLASVPKLLRGFVAGRINAAVADRGKPHFLPLTEDESAWRALVHYQAANDPYVLLVDSNGVVRWQTQGPPTEATYATLKQQVGILQSHQGALSHQ